METRNDRQLNDMDCSDGETGGQGQPVHLSYHSVNETDSQATLNLSRQYLNEQLERLFNSLKEDTSQKFQELERLLRPPNHPMQNAMGNQTSENSTRTVIFEQLRGVLPMFNRTGHETPSEHPDKTIRQKLEELEHENRTLVAQKNSLEEEKWALKTRMQQGGKELQDANAQIRRITEQNSKYRSIFLKNSSADTDFPDDRVRDLFVELRDIIQRIVHRHYSTQGYMKVVKIHNPLAERQTDFRDELNRLGTESLQRFYMRSKMFEMVKDEILCGYTFGADKHEESFGDFENALVKSKKVSQSSLAEWRSRTIECAEVLGDRSEWPHAIAKRIMKFLLPQEVASARGDPAHDGLDRRMRELCDKAYNLSVLMRRSRKANFRIEMKKPGTTVTSAIEAEINPQYLTGQPGSIQGSKVAFTIFGGLTKSLEDSPEEQLFLEKPYVVCYN